VVQGLLEAGAHVFCIGSKAPYQVAHSSISWDIVDLNSPAEIAAAVSPFSGIDGLVCLAGRGERGHNQRPDDFLKTLKNSLAIQYNCVRTIRPYLWAGSSVVLVGSVWGQRAPDFALYLDLNNEPSAGTAAAYGGVRGLLRYLAVEMAPRTRVNCIVPGWFPKPSPSNPREDYIFGVRNRIPMGRIGVPNDIVGPTLFLLSSMSGYMTGQEVIVDGGFSCG
jgi:NAD(P)-dependent dehydrogenase (short-subunit alcohol dehydrogenase family)